jgi:hypothetical protein
MRAAPPVELLQARAMTRSISLQLLAVACAATACHAPGGPRFTTRGTIALERDGVVAPIGEVIMTSADAPGGDVSAYTDTWVREGATWRVLASHLSRAPAR